jgi:hypothetical protein
MVEPVGVWFPFMMGLQSRAAPAAGAMLLPVPTCLPSLKSY